MPSEIEQLKMLVEQLKTENRVLKEENKRLKTESREPETKEASEAELDKIIELANKDYAFQNSDRAGTYQEDWQTNSLNGVYGKRILRAGCVNLLARRESENVSPEFRQENSGELTLVDHQGKFVGFPRLGVRYQQTIHNKYGAFGEIFEISPEGDKYDERKVYEIKKLIKPVIFDKDESGRFILVEKGEIVLKEMSKY